MQDIISQLLDIALAFGFGVILVLVVGFWLFGRLKKDAEKLNNADNQNHRRKEQTAHKQDP